MTENDRFGAEINPTHPRVRNRRELSPVLIVEPWAEEFDLPPGSEYDIVATHTDRQPTVEVEAKLGALLISFTTDGSLREVWRDRVQVC